VPLPPRSYFHLPEIAKRWDVTTSDIACYTIDGLLEVSIMAIGVVVETGTFEADDRALFRLPEGETVLNGPQAVVASDLWPVFRHDSARIERFKPATAHGYMELARHQEPILVTLDDLLVTAVERGRFERAYGVGSGEPAAQASRELAPAANEVPRTESQFVHRDDYSEVVFSGELFRLGPLQASVVRQLHEASGTANPWRPGKELLSNSNASTMRIVDLFKVKKNWRSLIVSDSRGNYRLNLQDRPTVRPSHRAYRRLGGMFAKCRPAAAIPAPAAI
jgi:hypothetical protein